jgi:hypothetical protein
MSATHPKATGSLRCGDRRDGSEAGFMGTAFAQIAAPHSGRRIGVVCFRGGSGAGKLGRAYRAFAMEATMTDVKWMIKAREFVNCNCAYGCPCQFNALPTHGNCEAVAGMEIDQGYHGALLDLWRSRIDKPAKRQAKTTSWSSPGTLRGASLSCYLPSGKPLTEII